MKYVAIIGGTGSTGKKLVEVWLLKQITKQESKQKNSPFNPLSYTDFAVCLLNAVEEKQWTGNIMNVGKK